MAIRKVISRSIEDNTVAATDFQGAVTSLSNAGNLTFSSTGQRILGDFSNSTVSNRVSFQTNTTNANTNVQAIPNGTAVNGGFFGFNNSDPTNAAFIGIATAGGTEARLSSAITGTGTYLPLTMYTGGSERLRITTGGDVGIGTSTPNKGSLTKALTLDTPAVGNYSGLELASGATLNFRLAANNTATYCGTQTSTPLVFDTAGTERLRIASTGNVGINTTSPEYKLDVNTVGGTAATARFIGNDQSNCRIRLENNGSSGRTWEIVGGLPGANNSNLSIYDVTAGVTRMAFVSQYLLIGKTNYNWVNDNGFVFDTSGGEISITHSTAKTNGARYIWFAYDVNQIGSISQNGTTAISYNTTSDYRLKENIAPMTGALDIVSQLNPVTYNWKVDGSSGQGFIAHELQNVVPDAVTGEKDAIDAEGRAVYQGIDTSFLVATLTAAIQELKVENDALKQRLDAAGL